jgi:hypothetical protein
MQVYIANFGRANFLWPECRDKGQIVVLDDEKIHPFWLARDPEGYFEYAQKHMTTNAGTPVSRALASRWYNVNDWLVETDGDLWLHREKDVLWWTWSTSAPPVKSIVVNPTTPGGLSTNSVVMTKATTGWSDRNRKGQRLHWDGIHKKAREFLFTEGTFQRPAPANAAYALAMIEGRDLSPWHALPEWKKVAAATGKTGKAAVTFADARKKTIITMRTNAIFAVFASGTVSLSTAKEKGFGFNDESAMDAFLDKLLEDNDVCALTGLTMAMHGEGDPDFWYSLDRIDSSFGYMPENLQLVCRFANKWKGAGDNARFRSLVEAIRNLGS